MPTFTEFTFKGAGVAPEDAESVCKLSLADPAAPKLLIGATVIPIELEDEFSGLLDRLDAEDTSDGIDPEAFVLGSATPAPISVEVDFEDDEFGATAWFVKPPASNVRWSQSKARDFVAGAQVVRAGLGS